MTRLRSPTAARRHGANVLLAVVALAVGVALCEVAARALWPHWRDFYSGHFQDLVWVPGFGRSAAGRAGFDGWFAQNDGDFRVRIQLNAHGFREAELPGEAGGRLWALGDSLAFGWGVERHETFAAIAGRIAGLGVYNLASPGANPCDYEAALARMPTGVRPRAVVVGLTLENDITRRPCARGNAPKAPPPGWREDADGGPRLVAAKLYLIEHSALYNAVVLAVKQAEPLRRALMAGGLIAAPHVVHGAPDPADSAASAVSTADEIAFLRSMLPASTPFAVLIVPARFDVRDSATPFVDLRHKVVDALKGRGIAVTDPTEAFRRAGFAAVHFHHDGHWSPLGHRIAGEAVASWLKPVLEQGGTR